MKKCNVALASGAKREVRGTQNVTAVDLLRKVRDTSLRKCHVEKP